VPKVGWVRFRWSRAVPPGVKSYRVTMDRAGRWHIAFAAIPEPIQAPGNGEVVGVDRGVAVSAALSTGELLRVPGLTVPERKRLRRLERKLARARRGSERRTQVRLAAARLRARETDRLKDWVENVRAKSGLNRSIMRSGWGRLVGRLENKAPGRVEKIKPHHTSQRCSACGHVDGKSRESQAVFRCIACRYTCNADVNAARNIAAGHPTHLPIPLHSRGGDGVTRPVNREPHLLASLAGCE